MSDLFPHSYPSYGKIFHAVFEDRRFRGSELTWDEIEGPEDERWWREVVDTDPPGVLQRSGVEGIDPAHAERTLWRQLVHPSLLDSRASWRTLGMSFDRPSWPRRIVGPDEGTLDPVSLTALLDILESLSSTTASVMFVEDWIALSLCDDDERVPETGLVIRGPLRDVKRFAYRYGVTPQCWWAEDESWWVFTDHDSCVTFVGGTDELVRAIEAAPELESIPVTSRDVAFPDRHPRTPEVEFAQRPKEKYRGYLWFVGAVAVTWVTMMVTEPGGPSVVVWGPALVYGVYRLMKGLYYASRFAPPPYDT